jgi:hypothetical protein
MHDEENDECCSLGEVIEANTRPWNGYWSWRDKPIAERGAAQEILAAVGITFDGLVSRPEGQDPPDCEAIVEGQLAGIEVTELVHEGTLKRSLKVQKERKLGGEPRKGEAYFVWERADLILALQTRISAKDQAKLKAGPYRRYILVIHTDEMFLDATKVKEWLADATFTANRISNVVLGLAYEPESKCCPVFNLRICRCSQDGTPLGES